jgi:hypothetical protein
LKVLDKDELTLNETEKTKKPNLQDEVIQEKREIRRISDSKEKSIGRFQGRIKDFVKCSFLHLILSLSHSLSLRMYI